MGDSFPSYACRICNITCTGPETLQQHLSGTKHIKRERQSQMYGLVPNTPQPEASQSLFQSQSYSCQVCQTVMSGPEAYLAHMKGKPHAKKLKQQELIKTMTLSNTALGSDIPQETVEITPADEARTMPAQLSSFHFCSLCQVPLSGPESASAHYVGAQHSKNQKRSQYLSEARSMQAQPGFTQSLDYSSLRSVPLSGVEVMNGKLRNMHLNDNSNNITKEIAVEADGTEALRETYRQAENEVADNEEED